MEIKLKDILKKIMESMNYDPLLILGSIDDDNNITAIYTNDLNARHPKSSLFSVNWRYNPEIEQIFWWEQPTSEQKEAVKDWLWKKGNYIIKRITKGYNP